MKRLPVLKMIFNASTFDITRNEIGNIVYNCQNIRTRLKSNIYDSISLKSNEQPCDLCTFNSHLVLANYKNLNLTIYDKNYELVSLINKINGQIFQPINLKSSDKLELLFISDNLKHRILVLDKNYNFVNSIGSHGTLNNQFTYPRGLAIDKNNLYICDYSNCAIKTYEIIKNEEGEFGFNYFKKYQLDFEPKQIEIFKNYEENELINENMLACIRPSSKCCIYFYDLTMGHIYRKYSNHNGTIFKLSNNFDGFIYEFWPKEYKFFCYNIQGEIVEQIYLDDYFNSIYNIEFNNWESLTFFNSKFVISCEDSKKLILI